MTGRVPIRLTSRADDSTPAIDPAETPSRIIPIWAVDAPTASRTAGVRVTQDAIATPTMNMNANNDTCQRRASEILTCTIVQVS